MILAIMSDSDATFIGVCLMLYGAFSLGFAVAQEQQGDGIFEGLPAWVVLGIIALILGVIIVLAVNTSGCGDCVPEDPR